MNEGTDLLESVHICLTNALKAAEAGAEYDKAWEQAMKYQVELLRFINVLKYNKTLKSKDEVKRYLGC